MGTFWQKCGRYTSKIQVFVILSAFCDLVHIQSVIDFSIATYGGWLRSSWWYFWCLCLQSAYFSDECDLFILLIGIYFKCILFRRPHTPRLAIHLYGQNASKIGRWLFGREQFSFSNDNNFDVKTRQGYIDEDGGRRPGHLVLYPIEVKYIDYATQNHLHNINIDYDMLQFQQIYISRCLLMEKSLQCRTSSRTHLLSAKEPRAPICLES